MDPKLRATGSTTMAKVIILSSHFLKTHPRAGEETNFEEHYLSGIKKHTIRAGSRWKTGDMFSPRSWTGVPYKTKQKIIGPDRRVAKTYKIEINNHHGEFIVWINGKKLSLNEMISVAWNDGLLFCDWQHWFNKPSFEGQIIVWALRLNYKTRPIELMAPYLT
jgi:hypothetical protein